MSKEDKRSAEILRFNKSRKSIRTTPEELEHIQSLDSGRKRIQAQIRALEVESIVEPLASAQGFSTADIITFRENTLRKRYPDPAVLLEKLTELILVTNIVEWENNPLYYLAVVREFRLLIYMESKKNS